VPPKDFPLPTMVVKVPDVSSNKRSQKTSRPGVSRRDMLTFDILRTAGFLRRFYADLFDRKGITYQQYNVIRILRGAGPDGLPTLEIVKRMIDQAPGITRLLDRLERKHLIRRERPTNNRRQVICYVTNKGLALLRAMDPEMRGHVRAAARCLTDAEVETLLEYLERIRACE
jgi:DNA-binding MarR family transcriptional regulator